MLKITDHCLVMSHLISQLLYLLVFCLGARFQGTLASDKLSILLGDLIDFLSLQPVLIKLGLEHIDLTILILQHLLLSLCFIDCICVFLGFPLHALQFVHQAFLILLLAHQTHVQTVLLLTLLVKLVFLFIEGFL